MKGCNAVASIRLPSLETLVLSSFNDFFINRYSILTVYGESIDLHQSLQHPDLVHQTVVVSKRTCWVRWKGCDSKITSRRGSPTLPLPQNHRPGSTRWSLPSSSGGLLTTMSPRQTYLILLTSICRRAFTGAVYHPRARLVGDLTRATLCLVLRCRSTGTAAEARHRSLTPSTGRRKGKTKYILLYYTSHESVTMHCILQG